MSKCSKHTRLDVKTAFRQLHVPETYLIQDQLLHSRKVLARKVSPGPLVRQFNFEEKATDRRH